MSTRSFLSDRTSPTDIAGVFSSVLLIEDEKAHASLIQRALSELVADVTHVTSGAEGLQAIENSFFELVLCDLHLPDTTGIAIIRAIKELRPGLPIIVLSSSSNLDDAVSAMREGAWDYMVKQFSQEFSDGIRFVIQRTAERKQQQIREMQLRSERRNFWAAAHAAQDGLAILGAHGSVVFANEAFHNFAGLLQPTRDHDSPINVLDLLSPHEPTVSQALASQLRARTSDLLWNSELAV